MLVRTVSSEARPYKPTYARDVELIHDWIGRANKYINDTGSGSLQALFATLELSNRLNMIAALNLLGCNIKGQVVKNTKFIAGKLLKTKQAADRAQTMEAADAHQQALQPRSNRLDDPEYMISHRIAIVAFQAVMMRERAHSNEFGSVMGQHKMDLGVVIRIIFEAFLDYREGAHKGYFVNKFFPRLPSKRSNPSPPSPSADVELPFTPEVVFQLTDEASQIEMACRYLGDPRLFSKIRSLDLRSRSVQKVVDALLGSKYDAVYGQIDKLTADAMEYLKAFDHYEGELAQGNCLQSALIRLAVHLVAGRRRKFPREFEDDDLIASNFRVMFGLMVESLVAHNKEGSYFHRKLTPPKRAKTPKHTMTSKTPTTSQSVATSKSATVSSECVTTSKRTIAQANADSTRDESSNADRESQLAKKRKKQATKKHDNSVLEQTQEPAGNDTSGARDTQLFEDDSDAESSLFIPQTASPVAASSNNFFEEFGDALDKGQTEKYSVFSKGSESLSTPPPTASNVRGPQKQRPSALPKANEGDHSPIRSKGKNGGICRRRSRK